MNKSTACQELIIIGTESKDVSAYDLNWRLVNISIKLFILTS